MNEVNEVISEVANARREARHYLMQLIHYLRTIRHGISRRNHMYTKQDVLREAQKKFDKFMKNMNYYETHKREAKRDTYQNNPSETENHDSDKAYRIEMIEVKAEEAKEIVSEVNDKEIKVEQVNVPENVRNKSDKQYECPTLSKLCREEQILRVDVKNWLVKEGYITDMKNVTPKGKDIGIREIIADHNNKRLVYDEKAQNFIKSHIDDIEKLSGRSVKKHNTDEYLKKIKSVAKEAKTKDITNDITV